MEEIKLPSQLTEEEKTQYNDTADQLAKTLNVTKVHVFVSIHPETQNRAVCYLKEPNFVTKIAMMDKASQMGAWMAANELREIITIKESSDALTYSESPESDAYKMGVNEYCMGIVNRFQDRFKKK